MATLRFIAAHIFVIYCVRVQVIISFPASCLLYILSSSRQELNSQVASCQTASNYLKTPVLQWSKKAAQLMSILIENHCEVPGAIYNLLLLNCSHYFWFEYCLPVTLNCHLMCDLLSLISVAEIEMVGSRRKLWFCDYCPLFNTNPSFWIVWLSAFSWLMAGGGLDWVYI